MLPIFRPLLSPGSNLLRPTHGVIGPRPIIRGLPLRQAVLSVVLLLCFTSSLFPQSKGGIERAGDILQFVLPAAAAGDTLIHWDEKGAIEFGESAALTLGITSGLKYAVNERRPNGGNYSFPSGHASISFSSAEFLRKRYGWKHALPAYALATFVAYSRVESKQHYTRDVVAGGAVGIISSEIFTRTYTHKIKVQPFFGGKDYGIRISRTW
jgi:membrane-associated phospholipid phosphatase